MTAFLVSVFLVDLHKVCEYNSPVGRYYVTVSINDQCPTTLNIGDRL